MHTFLKRVKLQGYRTIKNVDVEFKPGLNIIIGKNGSGKTNFMTFLHNCLIQDYSSLASFESLLQFSGKSDFSVLATRNLSNINAAELLKENRLDTNVNLSIESEDANERYDDSSELTKAIKERGSYNHIQFIRHGVDYQRFSYAVSNPLSFDLSVSQDGKASSTEIFEYYRKSEGCSFTHSLFLFLLIEILVEEFKNDNTIQDVFTARITSVFYRICDTLNQDIHKYLPIESVRLNPAFKVYRDEEKGLIKFQGLIFDFKFGGDWLPFSSLSDGTKRLFYLFSEITVVPSYYRFGKITAENNIVLVEEPELGIHPHQLHLVLDFLREVSTKNQVIITTHSPQALDVTTSDELGAINISSYNSQEGTTIKKLTPDQITKAKKYMEEMYLSDYWVHSNLEERL